MNWPLDGQEREGLADDVRALAWAWTRRMLALPADAAPRAEGDPVPAGAVRQVALAKLAAYEHLRKELDAQAIAAASGAADAGADYPEIGEAVGLSRQGARQRWPGLAERTKAARVGTPGQPPLSEP